MLVIDFVRHMKVYRTSILAVGLAIAAIAVGPSPSFAQRNSLEPYTGIWIVNEIGGFLIPDRKGFWEIKQAGESLEILIPSEDLTLHNLVPKEFQIRSSQERPAGNGKSSEKYTLDILFSETGFRGNLLTPGANYEVIGKLTEASRQYRKELARLREFKNSAGSQVDKLFKKNEVLEKKYSILQEVLEETKQALSTNTQTTRNNRIIYLRAFYRQKNIKFYRFKSPV